jgi:hypothetical protein
MSLYEVLHAQNNENEKCKDMSMVMKISLCLRTARILNTLHSLKPSIAFGSLSSHNLMLDLDFTKDSLHSYRLLLSELELHDFKKYANMFGNYRPASVWSAPEVLK